MNFEQKLSTYAELLVKHGLNVQPGQPVNVVAEVCNRDFAIKVVEQAYKAGACIVNLDLVEPRLARTRILNSKPEDLSYVSSFLSYKYKEFVDTVSANLRLVGMEYPEILSDLDPKLVNTMRIANFHAMKHYYQEGIERSKVHWTVAAAPTKAWAKRIFPELSDSEAEIKLWNEIFRICRADRPDCLHAWRLHNEKLHKRSETLTKLKIRELIFKGPGTDLKVGLSNKAIFKGGGDLSPRGVEFEPNIPTEECFTTPDYRQTEGIVAATRPFLVNGKLIEGLEMRFEKGILFDFKAKSGGETFKEYIDSDPGGRRLGEVALVGTDSPIYQSGYIFEEILLDENAACHIAVGLSYKFCLEGGAQLTENELQEVGANQSSVHTDIMISSDQVDVEAISYSGERVHLIKRGQWMEGL